MFDLSFSEIALIVVVAVVFIGPKELPAVIRAISTFFRGISHIISDIKAAFAEVSKEVGLDDAKNEFSQEMRLIQGDDGQMYEAYGAPKRDGTE